MPLSRPFFLAKHFQIDNEAVLDAVKYHTTGTSEMKPLTQLLFLADYLEPGRDLPNRDFLDELVLKNLDAATYAVSLLGILKLLKRSATIHPNSLDCYNWYVSQVPKSDRQAIRHQLLG